MMNCGELMKYYRMIKLRDFQEKNARKSLDIF